MATNSELKKFAQSARRQLREQVAGRLEQVLGLDSVEVREKKNAVDQLKKQIAEHGKAEVIDRVAYTWFNRFCALRYMDANLYNPVRVVSPTPGNVQPELLQEAKRGYLPEEWKRFVDANKVFGLLNGSIRSENSQQEAFRMLVVGVCNAYAHIMPFMFEEIEDYTELLMPLDLLSENSVLVQTREALTDEACQDVEVIGWLYQYYISERKDEVFEQVKRGKKIEAEDIPAVTQLFTPHWIVRYLVENSLGRLWLLNHPDSKIIQQMDYYIRPVDEETDFLKVTSPEELKICDPACGSGHMLTYAFDLLYAIYEEQGYDPVKIPSLILEKNLYGIEIDERAGALAAFALSMKARGKDKRFFNRDIQPNICVLENVSFSDQELKEYGSAVGRDLFTEPLLQTLKQFEQSKNFGSLIQPALTTPAYIHQVLNEKNIAGNLFLFGIHEKVMQVLKQSEYLSPRYHVVVANPPYMGTGNANDDLRAFSKDNYPRSRSDVFAMFIERNFSLNLKAGYIGMITMHSWMFLSSFEDLRVNIVDTKTISSLVHLGTRAFDSIGGEVVSTTAFVIKNRIDQDYIGDYYRLVDATSEIEKANSFICALGNSSTEHHFRVKSSNFKIVPGSPIAYWVNEEVRQMFRKNIPLSALVQPKSGMSTTNNERFLRYWFEVSINRIGLNCKSMIEANLSGKKWFPYSKGGTYRRWYGNFEYVVNWQNDGKELKEFVTNNPKDPNTTHWSRRLFNLEFSFKPVITWSSVCASLFSARYISQGSLLDSGGSFIDFENDRHYIRVISFLNTKIVQDLLLLINPTINYGSGTVAKLPFCQQDEFTNEDLITDLIKVSKRDWDNFELSWDFSWNVLFANSKGSKKIEILFSTLISQWKKDVEKVNILETANNIYWKEAFNLQNEFDPKVPIEQISINCNPYYRYGADKTDDEYELLQRADTIKEFISYAVGCMFGRYSLDKPGLVLANQGETLQDYLRQVPDPTFLPDEDNVIPIIGGDWFQDDIIERFKKFLKITFSEEHYSENLQFIEEAMGRDIESYFLKDFYDYHLKMYKKRPIYWMFSSPKGTFNALIYMHRYNKDTVSILLNQYVKQFRVKLEARKAYVEKLSISASGSQRERTAALRELETLKKQLEEITTYENKVIFPLATKQIEIDLDDGVKTNYPKFGEALVPIKGLTDKEG